VLFIFSALYACSAKSYTNNEKIIGYNLTAPDVSLALPHVLQEISGLTYIDSSSFACIQDEKGIVFIYNYLKDKIKKKYEFNIDGDYEGIARVNNTIYILRSDGTLFEILDYKSKTFQLNSYVTGLPANNNEGLCYDPDNDRLLIACKGKIGKGHEYKDKRVIYGFDLNTKQLSEEPVFDFDLSSIKEFALREKVDVHIRSKKKGRIMDPVIKFMTSDIAIHPITKKLFLLSASDHMLFIFSKNGQLEHIEKLNPELFVQAEGITFLPDGEMFITNEGRDRKATLLRFKYKF
jgi:uncharacterized protein YjiK